MTKNIVVCLDGTGNEVKATGRSNVVKLFEVLDLRDPERQVGYYDPGVGTFASPSAWSPPARFISRMGGLALGNGMRQNLGEAYRYLMNVWQPDDRVFVFGFSRGAYTARALAGMVHRIGLLRPGSEHLVPYAVSVYARRRGDSDLSGDKGWDRMDVFSEALARTIQGRSRSLPIHFMGLFDTVKAANILGRDLKWPYTRSLPNVRRVRHAVSINEKRRPYREYLIDPDADHENDLRETWFAGVHSDIGGSFPEDSRLGNITLRWVIDAAESADLVLREKAVAARCSLTASDAVGRIHANNPMWVLATFRTRPVPARALVHGSVRDRLTLERKFRPHIPSTVQWDLASWPEEPSSWSAD